jgi:hypothetical protein
VVHAIERETPREMLQAMPQGKTQEEPQEAVVVVMMQVEIQQAEETILAAVVVEEQQVGLAAMMVGEVDE